MFDYHPDDIFGCVADIGWITGHTYVVYGPLCNGATSVLFESTPTYPDPGRYWEMVERLRVNQFYGAPTAIRLLLKSSNSYVTKYDRSSLKLLGTGWLFDWFIKPLILFFAVLLLREKQKVPFVSTKEPFCFSNVFCTRYFSKTKRKPAKKNTEKQPKI